jgi:hypothetical protein
MCFVFIWEQTAMYDQYNIDYEENNQQNALI